MSFAYSLIHNRSDTQPQRTECDFWDFVLRLAQPDTRGRITLEEYRSRIDDKRMQARWKVQKDGPAWIPATFTQGGKRLDRDVSAVYAATLDFDDGVDRQMIEARLNGYQYAAHTSYSHHPEAQKWRAVIPLARPVPPAVFAEAWAYFNGLFDGKADPSGKNPSHLYYLPAVPPGGETFYRQFSVDGEVFDPAALEKPAEQKKPIEQPEKPAEQDKKAESFFSGVNAAAMGQLSAWVPRLFPTAKPYHEGYRVSSADLKRDREEDLSIVPEGIKDFGEHDMGDAREGRRTPIDLVVRFGTANAPVEAALWLCQQLDIQPDTLGYREQRQGELLAASLAATQPPPPDPDPSKTPVCCGDCQHFEPDQI